MLKNRYSLICIAMILFVLAGCSGSNATVTVGLAETFTISVGHTANITGQDMTVTFNRVIGDNRCPQNATCVWEGVASSETTFSYQGQDYIIVLNSPGLTSQASDTFVDYTVTYSLNPYPRQGEQISPNDYALTMSITK
jgi:hypothetical protein